MLMDIPRLKRMMVRVLCWRMGRKIIRRLLIWLIRRNRIWLFGGIRLCDFVCLMAIIVFIIDMYVKLIYILFMTIYIIQTFSIAYQTTPYIYIYNRYIITKIQNVILPSKPTTTKSRTP